MDSEGRWIVDVHSLRSKMPTCWQAICLNLLLLLTQPVVRVVCGESLQISKGTNLLLLVADDLGYGEVGREGHSQISTPHIEALAKCGVRCTQAYVTAPNCSPSRAGIFSGRPSTRFGYEFNPVGSKNEEPNTGLPRQIQTLPEFMRSAGYVTGIVGKWHLGGAPQFHPLRHGFDEFFGFTHEGHYYVPTCDASVHSMLRRATLPVPEQQKLRVRPNLWLSGHTGRDEPAYDANNPIVRNGQPVEENEYLTDVFTREAIHFLDRYQQTPWFLTVSYNAVHSPLQGKSTTYRTLSDIDDPHRRIFASMLVDLDRSVGAILGHLEELELTDRTLVIFLSDNGGATKELTSSNLPLRGGKGSMYEGGIRVPFVVSWPGHLPQGKVCNEVISSIDIYATVAEVLGQPPPKDIEGTSLLPWLKGSLNDVSPRILYWRQGPLAALRYGDWKIVSNDRYAQEAHWELYNLKEDVAESINLAQSYPKTAQELKGRWEQLDSQMAEPLFH